MHIRWRGLELPSVVNCETETLTGTYGNTVLPRSDVDAYYFVLGPLASLAPDLKHPISGRSMAQLWAEMNPGLAEHEKLIPVSD